MDHAVVRKWLRDVLAVYPSSERVFVDVDAVLLHLSSLAPRTEVFTHDTGHSALLLQLRGTLPVVFRGATYHIPVAIWLPRAYPREPPMVFVEPTSTMLVRQGPDVELSGRVKGVYLKQWERKWETCNLVALTQSLQELFSQMPPVYAKPAQPATPSGSASPARAAPASPSMSPAPRSPQPPADPRQRPPPPLSAAGEPRQAAGPPVRPPKPGSSYDGPSRSSSMGTPGGAPLSPLSQQGHWGPPQPHEAPPRPLSYDARAQWAGQSGPMPEHRGSWHAGVSVNGAHAPSPLSQHPHAQQPPPRPQPPPTSHSAPPPAPPPSGSAPPRPPNPELLSLQAQLQAKLAAYMQTTLAAGHERNEHMRRVIADLDRGAPAVVDEMARLEAVRDVCRATGDGLQRSVDEVQARIRELDERPAPSADELICATSIVGNQLLDLVAEDNAIEDTLYHLGRALNAEQLGLERFLKLTRFLAREQFMKRALAQRICEGMGWPDEGAQAQR